MPSNRLFEPSNDLLLHIKGGFPESRITEIGFISWRQTEKSSKNPISPPWIWILMKFLHCSDFFCTIPSPLLALIKELVRKALTCVWLAQTPTTYCLFIGLQLGLISIYFGPRVYPMGSIVIALVRPSVSPSVFKYLGDRSFNFSETLHEVRGQ